MTTTEKMFILIQKMADDCKIEFLEANTDFGTKHYEICLYSESNLIEFIGDDEIKTAEYNEKGSAAFFDSGRVFRGTNIDEVVDEFFRHCVDNKLFQK